MQWAAMLRMALGRLRLKPEEFWALTPVELMLMSGEKKAHRPLTRERLKELEHAFPDAPQDPKEADQGGTK